MASMSDYRWSDVPPNAGHWPGAARRRAEQNAPTCDTAEQICRLHRGCEYFAQRCAAREGVTAAPSERQGLTRPAGLAEAHDAGQLDAAGRLRLHTIADAAGVDPAAVGQRVHVARTRRGILVMLSVYTLDAAGQPVTVLGVPEVRHIIRPVSAGELPEAWRRPGDR